MRKNLPITNQEVPVSETEILISRTDLKGIITYASRDFVHLSGFEDTELIGSPHNIVRHPDVPSWLFQDLWETIRSGRPWSGPVKNRSKGGHFYWVFAEVTPLRKNGAIVGYMSNRYRLGEVQKREAEALYKLKENPAKRKQMLFQGRFSSIKSRFLLIAILGMLYLAFTSALQFISFQQIQKNARTSTEMVQSLQSLEQMYVKQTVTWNLIMSPGLEQKRVLEGLEELKATHKNITEMEQGLEQRMVKDYSLPSDVIDPFQGIRKDYGRVYGTFLNTAKEKSRNKDIRAVSAESRGQQASIATSLRSLLEQLDSMEAMRSQLDESLQKASSLQGEIQNRADAISSPGATKIQMNQEAGGIKRLSRDTSSRLNGARSNLMSEKNSPSVARGYASDVARRFERIMSAYSSAVETEGSSESMDESSGINEFEGRVKSNVLRIAEKIRSEFARRSRQSQTIHLGVIAGTLTLGIVMIAFLPFFISRKFLRPLKSLQTFSDRMAEGNLAGRIQVSGRDEVSRVLESIMIMSINIRGLISQIVDSARSTGDSTEKISRHSARLSEAAREQAVGTEETSASVEQLTSAAENVVSIIHQQTQNVEKNREGSGKMVESMKAMEVSMEELKGLARASSGRAAAGESTINEAVQAMEEVRTQAARISEIVNIITDISEQTNLLSLNASIEAARAGEGGRGFAVVADEISRLADRTNKSVQEIEKLVRLTGAAVGHGSEQFGITAHSFKEIISRVNKIDESSGELAEEVRTLVNQADAIGATTRLVTEQAAEIETASIEQKRAMAEINDSIQSISVGGQTVGTSAEDLALLVEEMSVQSEFLSTLVEQFRIK